jgi:hypothetical protein
MKKAYEKAQQEEAFKKLLIVMGVNGEKLPYAIDKLIMKNQGNGFKAMTPKNLYYRLKHRKEYTTIDSLVGKNLSIAGDTPAVLSDLSGETFYNNSNNATETSNSSDSIPISAIRSNIGGWKRVNSTRKSCR